MGKLGMRRSPGVDEAKAEAKLLMHTSTHLCQHQHYTFHRHNDNSNIIIAFKK